MTILAIESSCDETSAAVLTNSSAKITVLSNITATSLSLHARTGGIIPEAAAREQIKCILPVIEEALEKALSYRLSSTPPQIDAIAVTYGPGLVGSLLVGIETAKTLSLIWDKPLIPVNHLFGHIYANFINNNEIAFPAIALVVSGGHTDIVFAKSHTDIEVVGQTRDDACGEAFDKIGRLLNLDYPAGAKISALAKKGDPKKFTFPRPMIGSLDYNFSFSGLKTSVLNFIKKNGYNFTEITPDNEQILFDICASVEFAITDVLTKKLMKAVRDLKPQSVLVGGGVAANEQLRIRIKNSIQEYDKTIELHIPSIEFCTDNAAMIGANAFFKKDTDALTITAQPNLYYS